MKFKFKIQGYQTEAVDNITAIPVGNYAPDWAIAMQKGDVKHIFFVAETKGSLLKIQLNAIETAKIDCCTQLFNDISTDKVKYHKVTCYQDLIDAMTSIK